MVPRAACTVAEGLHLHIKVRLTSFRVLGTPAAVLQHVHASSDPSTCVVAPAEPAWDDSGAGWGAPAAAKKAAGTPPAPAPPLAAAWRCAALRLCQLLGFSGGNASSRRGHSDASTAV